MSTSELQALRAGPATTTTIAANDTLAIESVAIPSVDPALVFDVDTQGGVITRIAATGDRDGPHVDALELWPGYVEAHAHLGLPANFDDSLDDPRLIALQYLFHGVTHIVDMFGFPVAQALWESGERESRLPYPELVHCGYAATSMVDSDGYTGHGVEFPAPVFMLGADGDLEFAIRANRERGARFLKVMFTDGTEQPGGERRFSRLSTRLLEDVARVSSEHATTCVLDCNTRAEVLQAYGIGFRIFAHSVRDVELSADDWETLRGACFVSTLSGLRPLILHGHEFLHEYGRPGFRETQDVGNLEAVAKMDQSFGVQLNRQDSRLAALEVMRHNSLEALDRDMLLVGTDCGNLGAFHGYSLLSELDQLARDDGEAVRLKLRHAATVRGLQFYNAMAERPDRAHPIATGETATFNLLEPILRDGSLSALPRLTVMSGEPLDPAAVLQEIGALRSSPTRGKLVR